MPLWNGNANEECSTFELQQCSFQMRCPVDVNATFHKSIGGQLWRVNALLVVEAVLAAVIVGIGAYGQRYRHHPITRFVFLGANTIFLPIISYVASTVSLYPSYIIPVPLHHAPDSYINGHGTLLLALCAEAGHMIHFIILASLVLVVMINTSTIVVVDDREGQCKAPPTELLIQGIWTFYVGSEFLKYEDNGYLLMLPIIPYVLLCSKIGLKYYAFEKARRSAAFGRNPGLVFVYMLRLQTQEAVSCQHIDEPLAAGDSDTPPPPLLVMRESEEQVERHPQGYAFKDGCSETTLNKSDIGLVTIDRVWQLDDNKLPIATPWLKDLCLSFALFKLLRCRFARYKLNSSSVGTLNFFQSSLLKAGEHDRVFGVISEELSFLHDYYYSSLPISYSNGFLPILGIFLSFLTIGYCILLTRTLIEGVIQYGAEKQLKCNIWCVKGQLLGKLSGIGLGRRYFDYVPLLLILMLAVTAEIRDMASYICSNWTKVALICHYINRNPSACSQGMQKWVIALLRCRCKLMNHWDDEMSQFSALVPHRRTTPIVLVSGPLSVLIPDHRRKVKVPAAVKVSIISALSRNLMNRRLSNGAESLQPSRQVGESFLWACNGRGTSDIILTWHIATCILEVKHPDRHRRPHQEQGPSADDHKITATHLSKYCAYLMIWCPELLPDNNEWSKGLYEEVKKDAERALAGMAWSSTPEEEYQKLVDLLMSENSRHEVLRNGAKLGKQLVETIGDAETAWKLLADFWSEMILYVAPSDNLKGHSEAIARGGELITLLWALLFHTGIVDRPAGEEDGAGATSAGAVV